MGELLVAMPLRDVSAALRAFFVLIHTHVESTFGDARRSMLQLLGGADVSTVITESCIRRAFQARAARACSAHPMCLTQNCCYGHRTAGS